MEIIKASITDLDEILNLQKLAYQENAIRYNDFKIPPLLQTLEELTEEFKDNIFIKAMDGGRIIGSVRGRMCRQDQKCENYVYIGRLFVHPDYQNKGIGKKLMQAIESEFDTSKFELTTGHLDNKNISLYTKLGYKIKEDGKEKISDNLYFINMEKIKDKD